MMKEMVAAVQIEPNLFGKAMSFLRTVGNHVPLTYTEGLENPVECWD